MSKNDKVLEKGDHIYVPGKTKYILYLDVCNVILITGCFNYL